MAHPKLDDWRGGHNKSVYSHRTNMNGVAIREASKGMFRIIAEDHVMYQDDWVVCEYDTLPEAQECADAHFEEKGTWYFVYDDKSALVYAPHGKKPNWEK